MKLPRPLFYLLLLWPLALNAQAPAPPPSKPADSPAPTLLPPAGTTPDEAIVPVVPPTPLPSANPPPPAPTPVETVTPAATPAAIPAPATPPPAPSATTTTTTVEAIKKPAPIQTAPIPGLPASSSGSGIRMNFQGASLNDVLNYLSESAGFVIVQEAPVTGTVNVVSRQSLTPEDAVDLLNAVLIEKGLIAIRSGRILKIVNRRDAPKLDLPVNQGSDPDKIPRKDEIVTQILPLRSGEAAKLIENLRPLIPDTATIAANDASNSIIMTDTQINIRRVARIIQAIDSSVSAISTIRVFPLTHADAKDLAEVLTQLFAPDTSNSRDARGGRDRRGYGGFPGFPGMPGMPGGQPQQSEAKQAANRVVAVADEQSNSIIVAAPEEVIPTIKEIILQVDTSITDVTETQIFRLKNADAVELAQTLTSLYADPTTSGNGNNNNNGRGNRNGNGGRPSFPFPFGGAQSNNSGSQSSRALQQARVVAVGDPRTNSLIVTASHDSMIEIATTVGRLDDTPAKKQRVYVHSLQHADAENVATILRSMFNDTSASNTRGSRLNQRIDTGATGDAAENFSGSGNRGGGGGLR